MREELEGDENMGFEMPVEVERTDWESSRREERVLMLAAVTIS